MTFISIALSSTVRLIGPTCATVPKGDNGKAGTRPKLGFNPNTPAKLAGMRMEPPPSVPSAKGQNRAASAADEPPDEPPGVFSLFHGLRVMPVRGESVDPFQPNSGVVVLPISTAPASRSRATVGASSFHGPAGSMVLEPRRVAHPFVSRRSFTPTGTPSRGDSGSPSIHRVWE